MSSPEVRRAAPRGCRRRSGPQRTLYRRQVGRVEVDETTRLVLGSRSSCENFRPGTFDIAAAPRPDTSRGGRRDVIVRLAGRPPEPDDRPFSVHERGGLDLHEHVLLEQGLGADERRGRHRELEADLVGDGFHAGHEVADPLGPPLGDVER